MKGVRRRTRGRGDQEPLRKPPPPPPPPPRKRPPPGNWPGVLPCWEPLKLFRLYVKVNMTYCCKVVVRVSVIWLREPDLLTDVFWCRRSNTVRRTSPSFFLKSSFAILGVSRGTLSL